MHLECRRLSCDLDREYDLGGLTCGISGPDISSRNTICLSFDLDRDLERQRSLSCDLDREIDRGLTCGISAGNSSRNTICLSFDFDRDLERQRSLSCDLDREIDRGCLTCGISAGISSRNTICLSFDFDRDLERQRSLSFEFDRDGDLDNDLRFGCRSRDIDLSLEKVNICLVFFIYE